MWLDTCLMEEEFPSYLHAAFEFPAQAKLAWRWLREEGRWFSPSATRAVWSEDFLVWPSLRYPKGLRDLEFPPPALFYRGELPDCRDLSVGIVGTREADLYSNRVAFLLASVLANRGVSIVSGGARGVDQSAHKGALSVGGHTVWVSAAGLDQPVSSESAHLRRKVLEKGGSLVSEMPPGNRVKPYHFLLRNRLIAAMSDVVIVIASRRKGGSMETARCAQELTRPVFAVPGDLVYGASTGTNFLIRSGSADLFEHPRQVWEALDLLAPSLDWPGTGKRLGVLPHCWSERKEERVRTDGKHIEKPSALEEQILEVVGSSPMTVAECAQKVHQPLSLVTGEVQRLVQSSKLLRIPGNRILQEPR